MIKILTKSLDIDLLKNHTATFFFIWTTLGLVAGSQLLYLAFLFNGAFIFMDLHMNEQQTLLLDALLSLLFFLQHSVLIRRTVRQKLSRFIPKDYYSAFYGITSAIVLIFVIIFWQKNHAIIGIAQGVFYWLLRAAFFLSLLLFFWGVKSLGRYDASGVEPVLNAVSRSKDNSYPLMARGAYRWVRHPLYLCTLIFTWSCPVLTLDRLLFNSLWTVYTVIGVILEERDLLKEFGSSYRQYQLQVPMLIPYRLPNTEMMQNEVSPK